MRQKTFPSPLGASYFQIDVAVYPYLPLTVSVPSRGILFPNGGVHVSYGVIDLVSVPSRGILFPNMEGDLIL